MGKSNLHKLPVRQLDAVVLWKATMKNQTHTFLSELSTKGLAVKSKKDVIAQGCYSTRTATYTAGEPQCASLFILYFTGHNEKPTDKLHSSPFCLGV